tara:strand:+ start:154 stop:531 length:378 start_codon:yes stop_codon:yes gene_type:complete
MALSNCNKDVVTNLFMMLNSNEVYNNRLVETVKTDSSTYAQLVLLSEQMNLLKNQAASILEKHMLTNEANSAQCKCKKTPGNYYYLYHHNNELILSLVSPEDGINYDTFLCKYYYDFDFIMKPIN